MMTVWLPNYTFSKDADFLIFFTKTSQECLNKQKPIIIKISNKIQNNFREIYFAVKTSKTIETHDVFN